MIKSLVLLAKQSFIVSIFTAVFFTTIGAHAQSNRERLACSDDIANRISELRVHSVTDGDTINLELGSRYYIIIRMLGMDTPETWFHGGHSQGPWGDKATDNLNRYVKVGDTVQVYFDEQKCDGYGRYLAYVHKGSIDLNAVQIADGFAVNFCIYPNISRCHLYGHLMAESLRSGKSFMLAPGMEVPYEWRLRIRGITSTRPLAHLLDPTYEVFSAKYTSRIPVAYRMFFMRPDDIEPPYEYRGR